MVSPLKRDGKVRQVILVLLECRAFLDLWVMLVFAAYLVQAVHRD